MNEHGHTHGNHTHEHTPAGMREHAERTPETVLTIRAHSGLSGDIFLAGMLRMTECSAEDTERLLSAIMPELAGSLRLTRRQVNHVGGWHAEVSLPRQHAHRTLTDITKLVAENGMNEAARRLATETFALLARAEAAVHGKKPEEVHFHEVGALDSILDICMSCELFVRLAPSRLVVSPLPVADGSVRCAHGVIPVRSSPAPPPPFWNLWKASPCAPFREKGKPSRPQPWPCCVFSARNSAHGPPCGWKGGR